MQRKTDSFSARVRWGDKVAEVNSSSPLLAVRAALDSIPGIKEAPADRVCVATYAHYGTEKQLMSATSLRLSGFTA